MRIEFVDEDGKTTDELIFEIPPAAPREFAHEAEWDTERTCAEFGRTLQRMNDGHVLTCMKALDRLDCWRDAFGQFGFGQPAGDVTAEALIWLWNSYGFQVARALKGCRVLVEMLRARLPAYAGPKCVLYRGELEARHLAGDYGMAWTTDPEVARVFAVRRGHLQEGNGVILKLNAVPAMIMAAPSEHSLHLREHEYLIDPRLIWTVDVLPCLGR